MSENDVFLESRSSAQTCEQPEKQLELPISVAPPKLSPKQQRQRENIEVFLFNLREESKRRLAIAQELFSAEGYERATQIKTEHFALIRDSEQQKKSAKKIKRLKLPHPREWDMKIELFDSSQKTKKREPKPYRPWKLERRQQAAMRGLLSRAHKQSAFADWWMPWLQSELLKNPWRFGACPLPSEPFCIIPSPERIMKKAEAIRLESEYREKQIKKSEQP